MLPVPGPGRPWSPGDTGSEAHVGCLATCRPGPFRPRVPERLDIGPRQDHQASVPVLPCVHGGCRLRRRFWPPDSGDPADGGEPGPHRRGRARQLQGGAGGGRERKEGEQSTVMPLTHSGSWNPPFAVIGEKKKKFG